MASLSPRHTGHGCEFLITSHSPEQTLGVFVQADGEPAAKLVEWDSHPRAVAIEYPYLVSLLRNDDIQIFSLETMQRVQTIILPNLLEPRLLSSAHSTLQLESSRCRLQDLDVPADLYLRHSPDSDQDRGRALSETLSACARHPAWRSAILETRPRTSSVLMTCKNAVQGLTEKIALSEALSLIRREAWPVLEQFAESLSRQQHETTSEGKEVDRSEVSALQILSVLSRLLPIWRVG